MSDYGMPTVSGGWEPSKVADMVELKNLRIDEGLAYEDGHPSTRPATVADWVEVGRQLGAEIREITVDEQFYDEWACLAVEWPGTYLVFRLPVESPTPKEGEQ